MFYYKLTQLCRQKGTSLTSLLTELNMSKGNLSKWKKGNVPKMDTLKRVADYFAVSPDYFFSREEGEYNLLGSSDILPLGKMSRVPVLGVIPAGCPILAEENILGYELAELSHPEDYFYLKVNGDSMINAGIYPNSLVLIKKQTTAENGQIVVCLLDSENATLKRFRQSGEMVALISENPAYEPILLSHSSFEEGTSKILGVAVEVKTKLL